MAMGDAPNKSAIQAPETSKMSSSGEPVPSDLRYPEILRDPGFQERFWAYVQKRRPNQCWDWLGPVSSRDNYGRLHIRLGGIQIQFAAHRVAWTLLRGPIPEGLIVRHLCINRLCCNALDAPGERHLALGDDAANSRDRVLSGANPARKLTLPIAREIRRLHELGRSIRRLAHEHDVSESTIKKILALASYREGGNEEQWSEHNCPPHSAVNRRERFIQARLVRTEFLARCHTAPDVISDLARKHALDARVIYRILRGQGVWAKILPEGAPGPWPRLRYDRRRRAWLLQAE
jgi:hypothetical protein